MVDDFDFEDLDYPQLTLETDDIKMNIVIKKDYSSIENIDKRKMALVKDLEDFIKEFSEAPESTEFMEFYDY